MRLIARAVLGLTLLGCGARPPHAPAPRKEASGPIRCVTLHAAPGDLVSAGPNTVLLDPATYEPVLHVRVSRTESFLGRLIPALHRDALGVNRYLIRVQPAEAGTSELILNGDEPADVVVPDDFSRVLDPARVSLQSGGETLAADLVAYTRRDSHFRVRDPKSLGSAPLRTVYEGSTLGELPPPRVLHVHPPRLSTSGSSEAVVKPGTELDLIPQFELRGPWRKDDAFRLEGRADTNLVFEDGGATIAVRRTAGELNRPFRMRATGSGAATVVLTAFAAAGGGAAGGAGGGAGAGIVQEEPWGRDLLTDPGFAPFWTRRNGQDEVTIRVANRGNIPVPPNLGPLPGFDVEFYLSADANLDAGDVFLGREHVWRIGAPDSVLVQWRGSIPSRYRGRYHVIWFIDSAQVVSEAMEWNNVESLPVWLGFAPAHPRFTLRRPFPRRPFRPIVLRGPHPILPTTATRVVFVLPNGNAQPATVIQNSTTHVRVDGADLWKVLIGSAAFLIPVLLDDDEEEAAVVTPQAEAEMERHACEFDRAKAGATQDPPPPQKEEARGSLPRLHSEAQDLRIYVDVFDPEPSRPGAGAYRRMLGDGRSFAEGGSSRMWHVVVLDLEAGKAVVTDRGCGTFRGIGSGGIDESSPPTEGMWESVRVEDSEIVVEIRGSASDPLLLNSPAMDYFHTFRFRRENGRWSWRIDGSHDGWPNHSIYIGGEAAYLFSSGATPDSLMPPMEVLVENLRGLCP